MECRFVLELLVHLLNKTPQTQEMMDGWDRIVQFDLEGEPKFYIQTSSQKAALHLGEHSNADVVIKAKASLFLKIIFGEVNADEAFLARQYELVGSVVDGTKFRRLGETAQNIYGQTFQLFRELYFVIEPRV